MKKTLLASLFTMALVSHAEATCLNLTNRYSGSIPAESTITAYGPITIDSRCRSVIITATVQPLGSGPAPKMWIERLVNGRWELLAEARGASASVITTAGTFQVRHRNDFSESQAYSGSITIPR